MVRECDPWASSFGDLACVELERCLGAHPVDCSGYWTPPEYCDDIALEMSEHLIFGLMVAGRMSLLMEGVLLCLSLVQRAKFLGDSCLAGVLALPLRHW